MIDLGFVNMSANDPKFFGFTEFLSGLALMVLAWTIGDIRYRFRIRTAPVPLYNITFYSMALLGLLTLMTDLWRAQEWPVLTGPVSPAVWQATLGLIFLLVFLLWALFAFIRPPFYGKRNAKRYTQILYQTILNASPEELAVVADELKYSVPNIINFGQQRSRSFPGESKQTKIKDVEAYANTILDLIGDPRFCRAMVASANRTIQSIFQQITKTQKYELPMHAFAKNLILEAMNNRDSFLFHEIARFDSGLLGQVRPVTSTIFKNIEVVKGNPSLLTLDGVKMSKWDAEQWAAYSRIALLSLEDYAAKGFQHKPNIFWKVTSNLADAVSDLPQLNGVETLDWDQGPLSKLRAVTSFIKEAIKILNKYPVPEGIKSRVEDIRNYTLYDYFAKLMFEVVHSSAYIKSPRSTCWTIQHNGIWSELFTFGDHDCAASKIIHFKFRRLVYNEINDMKESVNFKGARILGYCLNVMGHKLEDDSLHPHNALHRAILAWTVKKYGWVHFKNPEVARYCLVEEWSYDEGNSRLVFSRPAGGLRTQPIHYYIDVNRYVPPN